MPWNCIWHRIAAGEQLGVFPVEDTRPQSFKQLEASMVINIREIGFFPQLSWLFTPAFPRGAINNDSTSFVGITR